ncbi:hypothetical protein [Streptomyces malaysiensis]|uniref:Uncharacterized protein n=1 Tax=Streptomyces malaysiensis TaxID=92644 RepID=A0A7X5X7F1_STRMQ|nr:hypothetical protein [Streptomyces malaysiensis]NIY67998.1 hypothetical protein [Streptomyces malaysiensis]
MSDERSPVRKQLAAALENEDVAMVVMHQETDVPVEVAEAIVEQGLPVHVVGEGNDDHA